MGNFSHTRGAMRSSSKAAQNFFIWGWLLVSREHICEHDCAYTRCAGVGLPSINHSFPTVSGAFCGRFTPLCKQAFRAGINARRWRARTTPPPFAQSIQQNSCLGCGLVSGRALHRMGGRGSPRPLAAASPRPTHPPPARVGFCPLYPE